MIGKLMAVLLVAGFILMPAVFVSVTGHIVGGMEDGIEQQLTAQTGYHGGVGIEDAVEQQVSAQIASYQGAIRMVAGASGGQLIGGVVLVIKCFPSCSFSGTYTTNGDTGITVCIQTSNSCQQQYTSVVALVSKLADSTFYFTIQQGAPDYVFMPWTGHWAFKMDSAPAGAYMQVWLRNLVCCGPHSGIGYSSVIVSTSRATSVGQTVTGSFSYTCKQTTC